MTEPTPTSPAQPTGGDLAAQLIHALGRYQIALLDPRPVRSGGSGNPQVETALAAGRPVHGYEVTGAWADRLDHNIDPQHGPEVADVAPAAIEVALTTDDVPPTGALLVTVRADADAIGAMVVTAARASGIDLAGHADVVDRIRTLADLDRGPARRWRPAASPDLPRDPAATALTGFVADVHRPLPERVHATVAYLATGSFPQQAEQTAAALDRARRARADIDRRGGIRISSDGRLASAVCAELGAIDLLYRQAPAVVLTHPSFPVAQPAGHTIVKHTVGVHDTATAADLGWDKPAVCAALDRLEADRGAPTGEHGAIVNGWGGQVLIIGSPQGESSRITHDEVVAVVQESLARPGRPHQP